MQTYCSLHLLIIGELKCVLLAIAHCLDERQENRLSISILQDLEFYSSVISSTFFCAVVRY
jgi:hypothetical protein